jgi:hypothetical protein
LSRFRFHAFKYHLELADLFEKNQFTAVRWARQTGKSFSVSALLLKHLGAFGQLHCNWSKLVQVGAKPNSTVQADGRLLSKTPQPAGSACEENTHHRCLGSQTVSGTQVNPYDSSPFSRGENINVSNHIKFQLPNVANANEPKKRWPG